MVARGCNGGGSVQIVSTDQTKREVTALVADWIREQQATRSFQEIADELGVSKTQVIAVTDGSRGVGPAVENAVARLLYKGSVDALRAAAKQTWEQREAARATGADLPQTLRAALEFMRSQMPVPDEVVDRARQCAEQGTFLTTTWIAMLQDLVEDHRRHAQPKALPTARKRSAS